MPPNPSLERTLSGKAPWPRGRAGLASTSQPRRLASAVRSAQTLAGPGNTSCQRRWPTTTRRSAPTPFVWCSDGQFILWRPAHRQRCAMPVSCSGAVSCRKRGKPRQNKQELHASGFQRSALSDRLIRVMPIMQRLAANNNHTRPAKPSGEVPRRAVRPLAPRHRRRRARAVGSSGAVK